MYKRALSDDRGSSRINRCYQQPPSIKSFLLKERLLSLQIQAYILEAVPLPLCDCHIHCIASLRRVQGNCSIDPLCRQRKVPVKRLPVAHSSTSSASIPSLQPITYKRRVCITSRYQAFTAD